MSQTIGIKTINPVNLDWAHTKAITAGVREQATKHCQTVDRSDAFQDVLDEHGLRLAFGEDDSLGFATATQIISGSAGRSATDAWFINLSLTDVTTGRVIASRSATVSNFQDLLTISKTVTKALLQDTELEQDPAVTTTQDNRPLIIGTSKVIVETHVYEHKAGTHGNKRFMPCSFCQGRGKAPCTDRDGRPCPGSPSSMDCPYCNINSAYKGHETHGRFLTGRWE